MKGSVSTALSHISLADDDEGEDLGGRGSLSDLGQHSAPPAEGSAHRASSLLQEVLSRTHRSDESPSRGPRGLDLHRQRGISSTLSQSTAHIGPSTSRSTFSLNRRSHHASHVSLISQKLLTLRKPSGEPPYYSFPSIIDAGVRFTALSGTSLQSRLPAECLCRSENSRLTSYCDGNMLGFTTHPHLRL